MKKTKLRLWVKVVIALLIVAIAGTGAFFVFKGASKDTENPNTVASDSSLQNNQVVPELLKTENNESETVNSEGQSNITPVKSNVQARGYCNSFAGYTAAIVANGGNTTQADSYFGQAGLDVNISIEDNDDVIIQDFKEGKIDFFYMTVNKMPLVCKELEDSGINVVIPYLTDTSTGGDGIVANTSFQSIENLQNAKIAVARNSVSQVIPVYLFSKTNLDTSSLMGNFIQFDSTQEAVNAFLHGEVDAVSTWDMSTAANAEESKVLFTTKEAENLVIDALIFNKDFATQNPDIVQAIINGSISVVNDLNNGIGVEEAYDIIRGAIPDFEYYDNATMKEALDSSKHLGFKKNLEVWKTAQSIYTSFSESWKLFGYETDALNVDQLFDDSYLKAIEGNWVNEKSVEQNTVVATEETIANQEALLSKSAQITFKADTAEILPNRENYEMLDEFVEIANVFNNMVVVIEGNIFIEPGDTASDEGIALSQMRADVVKQYMIEHGVTNPSRIITKGLGGSNPLPFEIADPYTQEGRAMNRRCDIKLYTGESEADKELQG